MRESSYQRLKDKYEREYAMNAQLRLKILDLSKAIVECGGTQNAAANRIAREVTGMPQKYIGKKIKTKAKAVA